MKLRHLILLLTIVPLVVGCKHTSVDVIKLEQSYRVMICTEGRYWLPMSPEGPFPKWSQASGFQLKGAGIITNGTQQYFICYDADSFGLKYTSGFIRINEKNRTLELRADLSGNHEREINHSGIYKNCKFEAPVIEPVADYEGLNAYKGKYVKVIGQLQDNSHCKMNGGDVRLSGWYEVGPKYEFIGWVDEGFGGEKYLLREFEVITNK